MSRPKKATIDYFPHFVNHGKTLFIIEQEFGNDGYSFWFKLLEILGNSEHHYYNCCSPGNFEFLCAKSRLKENDVKKILKRLCDLGAINKNLWDKGIIRSENFINNLQSLYNRRNINVLNDDEIVKLCDNDWESIGLLSTETPFNGVTVCNMQQKPPLMQQHAAICNHNETNCGNNAENKENQAEIDIKSNDGEDSKSTENSINYKEKTDNVGLLSTETPFNGVTVCNMQQKPPLMPQSKVKYSKVKYSKRKEKDKKNSKSKDFESPTFQNDANEIISLFMSTFDEDERNRFTEKQIESWKDTIYDLMYKHHYTKEQIFEAITFARQNDFWAKQFLSINKLVKYARDDDDKIKYISRFLTEVKYKHRKDVFKPSYVSTYFTPEEIAISNANLEKYGKGPDKLDELLHNIERLNGS